MADQNANGSKDATTAVTARFDHGAGTRRLLVAMALPALLGIGACSSDQSALCQSL